MCLGAILNCRCLIMTITMLYGSRAGACKSLRRFLPFCDALCKKTARWATRPWHVYGRASGHSMLRVVL